MIRRSSSLHNLLRIGSEAVFVAGYGWLLSASVDRAMPGQPAPADTVAAGQPGQPDVYAAAFGQVVLVLAGLVTLTAVAVATLYRRPER